MLIARAMASSTLPCIPILGRFGRNFILRAPKVFGRLFFFAVRIGGSPTQAVVETCLQTRAFSSMMAFVWLLLPPFQPTACLRLSVVMLPARLLSAPFRLA